MGWSLETLFIVPYHAQHSQVAPPQIPQHPFFFELQLGLFPSTPFLAVSIRRRFMFIFVESHCCWTMAPHSLLLEPETSLGTLACPPLLADRKPGILFLNLFFHPLPSSHTEAFGFVPPPPWVFKKIAPVPPFFYLQLPFFPHGIVDFIPPFQDERRPSRYSLTLVCLPSSTGSRLVLCYFPVPTSPPSRLGKKSLFRTMFFVLFFLVFNFCRAHLS